jgi:DEAD/DEAH box helicase domain-containing protein
MGGIHAIEHAMIGLFPLFALCDRGDVGGISHTFHPQVGRPAIFVYDGYPGGIGLAERCYRVLDELLRTTLALVRDCPCELGCPSCIHSPKCGSGNKPLDKAAAILTLEGLLGVIEVPAILPSSSEASPVAPVSASRQLGVPGHASLPAPPRALVLDIETQRSAEEVGGWDNADRMGVAVAVTQDLDTRELRVYTEEQVDALLEELGRAALIIGFNLRRFDFTVLRGYRALDYAALPTLDLLEEIHATLGFRLSLNHLAQETLGVPKMADGLQSLRWWRAGERDKVIEYCKADVDLTRRLYAYGRDHGYLLYRDYQGRPARLPVRFGEKSLLHEGRFGYNPPS